MHHVCVLVTLGFSFLSSFSQSEFTTVYYDIFLNLCTLFSKVNNVKSVSILTENIFMTSAFHTNVKLWYNCHTTVKTLSSTCNSQMCQLIYQSRLTAKIGGHNLCALNIPMKRLQIQ